MYPYDLFLGITLYDILLSAGVICAILVFRYFSERDGVSAKYYNFILGIAVATVVAGYLISVVVQGGYNALAGGAFELNSETGATFLGGLTGGAAVFFVLYFGAGHFVFRDREHFGRLLWMTETAAVCIPAAHALGRLGCLTAGCCYGLVFDGPRWFTFRFLLLDSSDKLVGYRYALPVQLYEAVFLAALALAIGLRRRRGRNCCLPAYMISYGIWRFFIEYLRGDDRGMTVVKFLSPSQLTSLLLIAGGAVLYVLLKRIYRRQAEAGDATTAAEREDGDPAAAAEDAKTGDGPDEGPGAEGAGEGS